MLVALLDLLVPQECVHCSTPGRSLCRHCQEQLAGLPRRRDPVPAPDGLPPAFSVCEYAGVARSALIAHKERGVRSLTRPLGWALARAVAQAGSGRPDITLVPIPSSRRSRAQRGDDTVRALAQQAARHLHDIGVSSHVQCLLRQTRTRLDQSGLGHEARRANLRGAFVATSAPRARSVVLVDDVITTGATLQDGVRALRESGIEPIGVATVAATVLRRVTVETSLSIRGNP